VGSRERQTSFSRAKFLDNLFSVNGATAEQLFGSLMKAAEAERREGLAGKFFGDIISDIVKRAGDYRLGGDTGSYTSTISRAVRLVELILEQGISDAEVERSAISIHAALTNSMPKRMETALIGFLRKHES
jgi:hypothetical protein